tara:strand:+ start:78 stop:329 length:252 start_codon:yes stop_codon:yes gene_type:complete
MAIRLNDKWYDETQFTPEVKQAILQVTSYQKQINNLMQDVQNAKIIVAHHAKYIQDNVSSSAEIEEPKAEEAVEEPVSTETEE